jgi:hypothetical protein
MLVITMLVIESLISLLSLILRQFSLKLDLMTCKLQFHGYIIWCFCSYKICFLPILLCLKSMQPLGTLLVATKLFEAGSSFSSAPV